MVSHLLKCSPDELRSVLEGVRQKIVEREYSLRDIEYDIHKVAENFNGELAIRLLESFANYRDSNYKQLEDLHCMIDEIVKVLDDITTAFPLPPILFGSILDSKSDEKLEG